MTENRTTAVGPEAGARTALRAFTVLRIVTGLVWLSNGVAKLADRGNVDLGFWSFSLIDRDAALSIATRASDATHITVLGSFYRDTVVGHWGFFGVFLTVVELAIGLGLILGVASRLAAVGGLLLITPIWIMLWPTGGYLWEYPAEDLLPLALLAVVPAGRLLGADRVLAPRFQHRWPF